MRILSAAGVHSPARDPRAPGSSSALGLVLAVCTGNICRSPAVEHLLRRGLAGRDRVDGLSRVDVASAGTHGVVGHPVEPAMDRLLRADGVDTRGFAARRLTEREVTAADLVLALSAEHRSAVVELEPAALSRCFTLREFALLVTAVAPTVTGTAYPTPRDRLTAVVEAAHEARRARRVPLPRDLDIADPYRLGDAAYAQAYAAITSSVAPVVAVLRPPGD